MLKIAVSVEDPEGHEKLEEHFLVDFSKKGLFVKTPRLWPEGTDVKILVQVPTVGFSRELQGTVRWSGTKKGADDKGIGIEFKLSEEEIRDVIEDILKHLFR